MAIKNALLGGVDFGKVDDNSFEIDMNDTLDRLVELVENGY
jgi:hypothetical protein